MILLGKETGVMLTKEGILIAGITLMTDGILIGPIGPTFKQGNTIGGNCGTNDGTVTDGIMICGMLGKAGIGISRVFVVF